MTSAGGRKPKEQKTATRDRLTELPRNVIDIILDRIPVEDAVRTSVLARKWRCYWTTIPKLVFDESFYQLLEKQKLHDCNSIGFIIAKILILHRTPITRFYLFMPSAKWEVVDYWIHFLAMKGVKSLTLHTGIAGLLNEYPYAPRKLSSHVTSCVELEHLNIFRCDFSIQSNFRGFPKLRSLELKYVTIEAKSFAYFITSCPLLESLTIDLFTLNDLKVQSKSLTHLCVSGRLDSIKIKADSLKAAYVHPSDSMSAYLGREAKKISRMITVLGNTPRIEELSLGGCTLEFLAVGGPPMKLPTPLIFLKLVKILWLDFFNDGQIYAVLSLIRSAPNLQELKIWVKQWIGIIEPVSSSLGDGVMLSFLKVVSFYFGGLGALVPAFEMMKSLLVSSPALEKMFVEVDGDVDQEEATEICKELLKFVQAAPGPEIRPSKLWKLGSFSLHLPYEAK